MDKTFKLIARLFLGGLLLFESLNQFSILHFTLDFTWFGLMVTLMTAWLIVEIVSVYIKKTCGYFLPAYCMLLVTAGIYLDAFGDILRLYGQFIWYDQLAHFISGAAAAGVLFSIIWCLNSSGKIKMGLWGLGFYSLTLASFFGVLYELEEYFEDLFRGTNRLGDGPDTVNDLFLNIIGALVVIIVICIYIKYRKNYRDILIRTTKITQKHK